MLALIADRSRPTRERRSSPTVLAVFCVDRRSFGDHDRSLRKSGEQGNTTCSGQHGPQRERPGKKQEKAHSEA